MTNQELLEIINLAKKNQISVESLKRILKLMEIDGAIPAHQTFRIKLLITSGKMKDKVLLSLLEQVYQKGCSNWQNVLLLDNHPILKEYLKENGSNLNKKVWGMILDFVNIMPLDERLERFYVKELSFRINSLSIEELDFFHKVLRSSMNTPLLYSTWYLPFFLDRKRTCKNRNLLLGILKTSLFGFGLTIDEQEIKAKKIIHCFDLYGEEFASVYGSAIKVVDNLEIPRVTSEEEIDIYIELFTLISYVYMVKETAVKNFLTSFYYSLATNNEIDTQQRLEFVRNLSDINLILKDSLVKQLWNTYLDKGIEGMKVLKYAFLNKGIKTNLLCKNFLEQETSVEVLKLAREVFRKNCVRKDEEALCILNDLKTPAEKIEFLHFLDNKYPDINPKEEENRAIKEQELLNAYQAFLNNQIGLAKLEESLYSSEDLTINLIRKKKHNGRV